MSFPGMTDTTLSLTPAARGVPLFLRGALSSTAVERLRRQVCRVPVAPLRLVVDCSGIAAADPVGAALLWRYCADLEVSVGTRIQLCELAEGLRTVLRGHPLRDFIAGDEDLFLDLFGTDESRR